MKCRRARSEYSRMRRSAGSIATRVHADFSFNDCCATAVRADVPRTCELACRAPRKRTAPARAAHENDWSLSGRIIAFKPLKNPLSGGELFWIHLDLERIKLEVLVNRRALRGSLAVGATLDAEVWLQGHVLDEHALRSRYEGIDYAVPRASFWSGLRRRN